VFLVDHAWTYRANDARTHLENSPDLLNRMYDLMHIDLNDEDINNNPEEYSKLVTAKKVDAVYENMWKFNQHYKISTNFEKMVKLDDY
jgi:tubulin--tyrosine ligase-like protein 12